MLLALWSDFWNTSAWVPSTSSGSAVIVVIQPNSIGGTKEDYDVRAPEEYWDAREAYLRSKLPIAASASSVASPKVAKLVSRHRRVIAAAPKHPDTQQMVRMTKTLNELKQRVKKAEEEQDDDDVLSLLLM